MILLNTSNPLSKVSLNEDEQVCGFLLVLPTGLKYESLNYKWFSEEISGKTNLEANLSVPVTFGNKIKFIPSVNYIGERKYSYMSGLLIEPPQIDFGSLEDRYLELPRPIFENPEQFDEECNILNLGYLSPNDEPILKNNRNYEKRNTFSNFA